MEFKELIQTRRSIRAYKENQTIDAAVIESIIRDAQQAPSWKNSQTARYYVVNSPEMVAKVKAETLPGFNQRSSANAPALIVTTFVKDTAGFTSGQADNEPGNEWGAYDLGLANAYFVLSACEHGLDTLIMGLRDAKALHSMLNIPEEEEVMAVLALGYRESDPKAPVRKELDAVAKFY